MVSGAVHQSERNSRLPWSIILWVCFCFCTCTYVFTSPWYSQEQSVVLRDSLSSVSFYLCPDASSDPPGLPVVLFLSFQKQFFQPCSSFPRSLVLFPVHMKCWAGVKAEMAWIPELSTKLFPPAFFTLPYLQFISVFWKELSCPFFARISQNSTFMKRKSVFASASLP